MYLVPATEIQCSILDSFSMMTDAIVNTHIYMRHLNGYDIFPYHHSVDKSLYLQGKHLTKLTHHHNPALLTGALGEESGQRPADILRWSLLLLTI